AGKERTREPEGPVRNPDVHASRGAAKTEPVKILIAALHNGYYRNIESMVDELAARGHQLYLGAERHESALGGQSIVQRLAEAHTNVSFGRVPTREQKTRFL